MYTIIQFISNFSIRTIFEEKLNAIDYALASNGARLNVDVLILYISCISCGCFAEADIEEIYRRDRGEYKWLSVKAGYHPI